MNASEARQQLPELINTVIRENGRILVERSGVPVAAIVSPEDLDRLQRLDAERAQDFEALREISVAFHDVPVDELDRKLTAALAEVRAEMRAERAHTSSTPAG